MNRFVRPILLSTALLFAVSAGIYAQPADPDSKKTPDAGEQIAGNVADNMSAADLKTESETLRATMLAAHQRLIELQALARQSKDVIRLNCINDRLVQVKKLLNIGDEKILDMNTALSQSALDSARQHFSLVKITSENVGQLREEGETCIGDELVHVGPTQVTSDGPAILDDPNDDLPSLVFDRPSFATPFN